MQQIKIQLYDVTLREIMNAVVQERPEYEWNGNDDTIDISPAGQSSALLDVMINAFEVNDLDSSAAIDKLMNLPEVQQAMRTLNLRNAKATRKQVDRDVKMFSLNLHDVTLRQALHSIARASETQFWILRKSKDNPSTFSVSTSPGQ
jgi:type II secretory pathway component HofQ